MMIQSRLFVCCLLPVWLLLAGNANADLIVPGDDYVVGAFAFSAEVARLSDNAGVVYNFANGATESLGANLLGNPGDYFTADIVETQVSARQFQIQATLAAFDANDQPTIWIPEGTTDEDGNEYFAYSPSFGVNNASGPINGLRVSNTNLVFEETLLEVLGVAGVTSSNSSVNHAFLVDDELRIGLTYTRPNFEDLAGFDLHAVRFTITANVVPEPASCVILFIGCVAVTSRRMRS